MPANKGPVTLPLPPFRNKPAPPNIIPSPHATGTTKKIRVPITYLNDSAIGRTAYRQP